MNLPPDQTVSFSASRYVCCCPHNSKFLFDNFLGIIPVLNGAILCTLYCGHKKLSGLIQICTGFQNDPLELRGYNCIHSNFGGDKPNLLGNFVPFDKVLVPSL